MKEKIEYISCKFEILFSKPGIINILIFSLLTLVCFYLYAGFQDIYYTITQDYIAIYVGSKYIITHPTFAFVMSFPHFVPLLYPYFFFVQLLTNDTQWLNVLISLTIHITNAFLLFKITLILCENKLFPSLIASLLYLISIIHVDTLLSFAHSYPIMTSFFGFFSFYFFLKVNYASGHYERKQLYFSLFLYLLSVSFGLNFIGLILFYFLIMTIRIGYFKKDFVYMSLIASTYFMVIFSLPKIIRPLYNITEVQPISISFDWLFHNKIKDFEYSFLHLTSLFFPSFPITIASFFNDTKSVLENVSTYHNMYYPYLSLFFLLIPPIFLSSKKILNLYGLLILVYLLFVPYLFSPKGLNSRHLSQTVAVSSIFLGVLFHYVFESIGKVKVSFLRVMLNMLLSLFLVVFSIKYIVVAKNGVEGYIKYHSAFSPFIKRFVEEFKKVEVYNGKKQIYFLKNDIPGKYSFVGSSSVHNYYLFHLAVKYKKLPVDLYKYVYLDIDTNKFTSEEERRNYFIKLSDGSFYGFYRDREKLIKLMNNNPDIKRQEIIVLSWDDGLKQENIDTILRKE